MRKCWLIFLFAASSAISSSQSRERMTREAYFIKYRQLAISEMLRSGVPASITLAQGALESGDGNSRLARQANNHFGIKCHNDWKGKKIFHDDDAKDECFRKYDSAEESYRDHSDYLRNKERYAFLFTLDSDDYKEWARGLKKAGYATSPTYAEALIKIIEEHELYRYDDTKAHHSPRRDRRLPDEDEGFHREILVNNRVKYIIARSGDTYDSLTAELDKLHWELEIYNDASASDTLHEGDRVYLQPKRNRASAGHNQHILAEGETLYDVSQRYALKLERLYWMNRIKPGTKLPAGTVLQLRKPVKPTEKTMLKEKLADPVEEDEIRIDLNLD